MPRPCKNRRVCALPGLERFGPITECESRVGDIIMTVDEFESIRQIDLLGLTQEECAARMNVARTTAQAIYLSARRKLAKCLVDGCELSICGGRYELCSGAGRCIAGRNMNGDVKNMKIAVTYENGQIFQHFGHTEQFKIYSIADGRVISAEVVDTNGSGHGALAGFLREHGVGALICGGIGGGARNALAEAGIDLYPGSTGEADAAVMALISGNLVYDPDTVCAHHHGEAHDCEHHC